MVWAPGSSQNGSGYTDELVQVRVNNNLDDPMMSQTMLPLDYPMEMYPGDHWVLQDANYNVLGLVDRDGKMVERYEYSPYGERKVFVSAGANDPGCYAPTLVSGRRTMYTMVGGMYDNPVSVPDQPFGLCEFGHQGLPHEEEIDNGSMIQNRMRIRRGGTWHQRDPWQKNRLRPAAGDGYQDGMSLRICLLNNPIVQKDKMGYASNPTVQWSNLMQVGSQIGLTALVSGIDRCDCQTVGAIQFFNFVSTYDFLSKNWSVDDGTWSNSAPSQTPPYYSSPVPVSVRGTASIGIADSPNAGYGGVFEFKVMVVCAQGTDKGHVYGSYSWAVIVRPWFYRIFNERYSGVYDLGPSDEAFPATVTIP